MLVSRRHEFINYIDNNSVLGSGTGESHAKESIDSTGVFFICCEWPRDTCIKKKMGTERQIRVGRSIYRVHFEAKYVYALRPEFFFSQSQSNFYHCCSPTISTVMRTRKLRNTDWLSTCASWISYRFILIEPITNRYPLIRLNPRSCIHTKYAQRIRNLYQVYCLRACTLFRNLAYSTFVSSSVHTSYFFSLTQLWLRIH